MNVDTLLIQAASKLKELQTITEWDNELLSKAPPVLWFGNSQSAKPKILTVGANPSRWEFLNRSLFSKPLSKDYIKKDYETKYLAKNRFYHLDEKQSYDDIIQSAQLREKIINSFDRYFETNPYSWFGNNKNLSYKVEGVLRGMKASYFDNPTDFKADYQACHIDIFPFATMKDFSSILKITKRDILANNWAKDIVDKLIEYFKPEKILVFGSKNFDYFCDYFRVDKTPTEKDTCIIWNKKYNDYHLIGISTNLGNPRGFNSKGLFELGKKLNNLTK